ncbi:hypothetical protein GOZ88_26380 [Agrobacterium vitis]|uniref:Imm33-like domain-containing protein n=2 Tax=Agrobacterium vitis TaxID=373 RepID=A0A7K1RNJ6_AGRVI|nr:hypothetical protein [Agrobacterium vitis]
MELLEDGRFCLGVSKAVRVLEEQISLCKKFDANLSPPSFEQLAVISDGLWEGDAVKGVRYPSPPHMSGWWLITDRYDGNTKSLKTVHIRHVTYQRPEITKYISLPFGFRFSSQDDEVWFDEKVALDR